MDPDLVESLQAFAMAYLHKAIDESPSKMISLTKAELEAFVLEPGSTQLAFSLHPITGAVQLSHVRLDDQKH